MTGPWTRRRNRWEPSVLVAALSEGSLAAACPGRWPADECLGPERTRPAAVRAGNSRTSSAGRSTSMKRHILHKNNAGGVRPASQGARWFHRFQTENTPRKRDPQQSGRHLVTMAATRRHFFPRKPVWDLARIVRQRQQAGELTIMPRPIDPSRDLLFGLLALQTGLIDQAQLVAAFQAWTRDQGPPPGRASWPRRATSTPSTDPGRGTGRRAPQDARRRPREEPGGDRRRPLHPREPGADRRSPTRRLARPRRLGLDRARRRPRPHRQLLRRHGHLRRPAVPRPPAPRPRRPGRRLRRPRRRAAPRGGAEADPRPTTPTTRPAASGSCSRPRSPAGWSTPGSSRSTAWGPTATAGPTTPCGSSAATASRRPSSASTPTTALKTDPGRRSLELRKLLRRFIDVCNAIDYAHRRGVLHRDIKPGNIIVGKHGETLVVDWGLAKATGQSEPRRPDERTLRPSSASGSRRDAARAARWARRPT